MRGDPLPCPAVGREGGFCFAPDNPHRDGDFLEGEVVLVRMPHSSYIWLGTITEIWPYCPGGGASISVRSPDGMRMSITTAYYLTRLSLLI